MKRVMGYLQASVISLAIIAQNCEEKKGVYHAFLSVCREALVYQRSVFNIKSFKSQRIYQAIPGGDETVDLIRKGFRALQPPRMALVEAAGARPLPKFSLCILFVADPETSKEAPGPCRKCWCWHRMRGICYFWKLVLYEM